MTTLSIAVCAHISRKQMATDLAAQLDCPIAMDEGDRGCVANHDAALRLAAQTLADWCVVIEDDALPIPDFREQAAAALTVCPAPFANLHYSYIGQPDPRIEARLAEHDPHWVVLQGFYTALCVAIRSDYVQRFLDKAEEVGAERPDLPADHRWGEAAIRLGYWTPHAYPSPVEHRDEDSLIGPNPWEGFRRKAYRVGGRETWTDYHI